MKTAENRTVAYVVRYFHPVILSEISALAEEGWSIPVLCTGRGRLDAKMESWLLPAHRRIAASALRLPSLRSGAGALAAAHGRFLSRRPLAYLRYLVACFGSRGWGSPLVLRLKMPFAASILAKKRAGHLHAHFAREDAELASLISILLGARFSFTAHAFDVYTRPRGLREKIARAALVVASSRAAADHLRGLCRKEDRGKIVQFYNGVETDLFHPAPDREKERVLNLLCVARLTEKKGIPVLLRAFRLALDRGLQGRLLIVGDGPERGAVEGLARELNLGEAFRLACSDTETREELAGIYRSADLFVLPSIVARDGNREGIPSSVMEAMASGLPVVATRTGGLPEIVRDGETGLLVEPGSAEGLAAAILKLCGDPALAGAMGRAGRLRIETEFDHRAAARLLGGQFRRLLKGEAGAATKAGVCMFVNGPVRGDQRVFKEARTLADLGYEVSVLARQPSDEKMSEIWKGIRVIGIPRDPSPLFPLRFTLRWMAAALKLSPRVIHAHDLNTLGRGWIAARLLGARLAYDSHDFFSETAFALRRSLPWRLYYRWKEAFLIRRADRVIYPTDEIARLARGRLGARAGEVISNYPLPAGEPRNRALHEELGLPEESRIVIYNGYVIEGRYLDRLVLSAKFMPEGFVLVILGEGGMREKLGRLAAAEGLGNRVRFIDHVDLAQFPRYLAGSDLGIAFYQTVGKNLQYVNSTKVFDYLRAGLPVIISGNPPSAGIVRREDVGLVIPEPPEPESIARAAAAIIGDQERYRRHRRNALRAWETRYNWGLEAPKLRELYAALAAPGAGEPPRPSGGWRRAAAFVLAGVWLALAGRDLSGNARQLAGLYSATRGMTDEQERAYVHGGYYEFLAACRAAVPEEAVVFLDDANLYHYYLAVYYLHPRRVLRGPPAARVDGLADASLARPTDEFLRANGITHVVKPEQSGGRWNIRGAE